MSYTTDHELAGVVVHLHTDDLRARGGCQTNAVIGADGDRAVVGTHDFLVVGVDVAAGLCTAVPLFPKSAVGNQPLVESKKSGAADDWIGTDVFFSRWQHWRIPTERIVQAIDAEGYAPSTRRRYAMNDRSALDDIRIWEGRNRAEYRPV